MAVYERRAEGMTVHITQPWPRRVVITKDELKGGYGSQGLSIKEAEGLVYCLSAALECAKREDNKPTI